MAFDIMHAGRYIMAAASGTTNVADESVSDVIDSAAEATNEAAQEVNQFVRFVQDNIEYHRVRNKGHPCTCFFLFGKQSDQMDQENRTPVF